MLSSPAQHWATTRLEEKVIGAILVQVDPARRNQFEPPASKPLSGRSASKRGTRWSTSLVLAHFHHQLKLFEEDPLPPMASILSVQCRHLLRFVEGYDMVRLLFVLFFLGLFCVLFQAHPSR